MQNQIKGQENFNSGHMKNHAIELYRTEMIESRMNYIHENPVRAPNERRMSA
jgi:hypothetical protein